MQLEKNFNHGPAATGASTADGHEWTRITKANAEAQGPQSVAEIFFTLRLSAFSAPLRFSQSVLIRVHPWLHLLPAGIVPAGTW